jgi:heme exporter protein B
LTNVATKIWWIIHKDLLTEYRARRVWPVMLLMGSLVALVFSVQMDLLPEQKQRIVGSLLWLAIFFAGMLAIDRSFAAEREENCWDGFLLYPVSPSVIYLAKFAVNVIALAAAQCALIPLFTVLSGVPLLERPAPMLLVALLGNLGIAAVGTLLGAVTAGVRQNGSLATLLALPLVMPVMFAAAEATRFIAEDDLGVEWWRWVQLLGAFAVVFITAGIVLFDFLVEE